MAVDDSNKAHTPNRWIFHVAARDYQPTDDVSEHLLPSLTQLGFVKLLAHGIEESQIHDVFEWVE